MNCPKISIIVPCYNVANYIERTIDSVVLQDRYEECELILVDDASTDETREIVASYLSKYDIIFYKALSNNGVSAARNKGIEFAKGNYILFLDGDDTLAPNAISYLLDSALEQVDIISFGFSMVYAEKVIHHSKLKYHRHIFSSEEFLVKYFKREILQHLCSFLCRRDIIDKFKIRFDNNTYYAEDQEFQINCMLHCKQVLYLKDELFLYNIRKGSVMNSAFNVKRFTSLLAFERLFIAFESHKNLYKFLRNYALFNYYSLIRIAIRSGVDISTFSVTKGVWDKLHPYLEFTSKVGIIVNILYVIGRKARYFIFKFF